MAKDLIAKDSDDRRERMVSDPKRYFAEARERAEQEVKQEAERREHKHGRHTDPD